MKMNFKIFLTLIVLGFVVFCGGLVVESGLFDAGPPVQKPCILLQGKPATQAPPAPAEPVLNAASTSFRADHAPAATFILGAADPNTEDPKIGYKFQLELSSKGAAVRRVTFSNGNNNGFDNRDHENPRPLTILKPVKLGRDREILSMANKELVFVKEKLQLALQDLQWKSGKVEKQADSQKLTFEALVKDASGQPVIKLTKTYQVTAGSYLVNCDITAQNLSSAERKIRFNLEGPVGIIREARRSDMRKVIAGFRNSKNQITSERLPLVGGMFKRKKFATKQTFDEKTLEKNGQDFLWAAVTDKYFTAVAVPVPQKGYTFCQWIKYKAGQYYNPDAQAGTGDENIGLTLGTVSEKLGPVGHAADSKTYKFQLYVGPKNKSLFDKDKYYRELGFIQTIDFAACCCPAAIIRPLAFGIMGLMKLMYSVIPNYGVVIIILVFLVRLILHPLTKKGQVSMSRVGKITPKVEQIRKKYANNKAELNKQMMALYREQGASPFMGMLPMFVQTPIWIALWSAVYASIELRGAAFLPFWITDLSAPDALFRFSAVNVPLLGKVDSFNLLPVLMGVAFYLQQKLMPKNQAAAANPQMAQQQKMMMIMMPIIFPLLLYTGPSGVNLYIMSSVFAGVIEQYVIRKHIEQKEQTELQGLVAATSKTGGKVKKKKPKPFYKKYY